MKRCIAERQTSVVSEEVDIETRGIRQIVSVQKK